MYITVKSLYYYNLSHLGSVAAQMLKPKEGVVYVLRAQELLAAANLGRQHGQQQPYLLVVTVHVPQAIQGIANCLRREGLWKETHNKKERGGRERREMMNKTILLCSAFFVPLSLPTSHPRTRTHTPSLLTSYLTTGFDLGTQHA